MNYSYFPGCSLHSTGIEYSTSTKIIAETLKIGLFELPNWVCCGAHSVGVVNEELDGQLVKKNLELAYSLGLSLVSPCPLCFNKLALANSDKNFRVRHLLDVLVQDIGIEKIACGIKKKLSLSCACYYGCLLVRPREIAIDDRENPMNMDNLMETIGCRPIEWNYKVECCGANLSLPRKDIVQNLVHNILSDAREQGADCVVVACSLCHLNLDFRQNGFNMPIFYFTELLALAFGFSPKEIGLDKHITSPMKLLKGSI